MNRLVRVLDEVVNNPALREALQAPAESDDAGPELSRAERVERAVERYVQRADIYVAALTRKSEREAALYEETGALPAEITGLGELKSDQTDDALRAYRRRLAELARRGLYSGPIQLRRIRPDGSWENLHLRGD
ncbi:MAG TPA: hypothetical protein VFX49_05665 [Chloroflexota bacterium]|nr:hypothetical protein [Chloroflexota bacterium]